MGSVVETLDWDKRMVARETLRLSERVSEV